MLFLSMISAGTFFLLIYWSRVRIDRNTNETNLVEPYF